MTSLFEKKNYIIFSVLILAYVLISFLTPLNLTNLAKYNITPFQDYLIIASFVVIVVGIWATIFYSYLKFRSYTALIQGQPDAEPLKYLSYGLAVWAWGSPISSLVTSLFSYATTVATLNGSFNLLGMNLTTATLNPISTIVSKYISVIITVAALYFISRAAELMAKSKQIDVTAAKSLVWNALYFLIAGLYIYAVLHDPNRATPIVEGGKATYYLPDLTIIFTIVLPYLFSWFIGFQAAASINAYRKQVQGVIYRDALKFVALGVNAVILGSVFTQFLTTSTVFLVGLLTANSIVPILILIYVLLAIIAVGYILIAVGANKLNKIEKV